MNRTGAVLDDLGRCWREVLGFELLFKALQTAILAPVLAWMASMLIESTGRLAISNTEIISFLLSPVGMAGLFLAAVVAVTLAYVEQAGIMSIVWGAVSGQRQTALVALGGAVGRGPMLLRLGMRQIVVLAICLAPLAAAAALTRFVLLDEYDINYYLAERPSEFAWACGIGAVLAVLAAVVFGFLIVRWVFAMQGVLLDGKTPQVALKGSAELLRGSYLRVGSTVLACLAAFTLLPGLLTWILGLLDIVLFAVAGENLRLVIPIALGLMALHWLVLVVVSAVTFSAYVAVITRLYAEMSGRREAETLSPRAGRPEAGSAAPLPWLRRRVLLIAVGILVLLSAGGTHLITDRLDFQHDVEVTAHRGYSSVAPENTLSAIRKAAQSGADFAEIDVQLTADGVVVVIHDADLMRIAGIGRRIAESRYEEIRSVDAGSWFSPEFKGERIPTLTEAIEESRGKIRLNIELKFNDDREALVRSVVEIAQRQEFRTQCVVTSLDYEGLLEVERVDPEFRTGFIAAQSIGRIAALDVDFLSVNSAMVNAEFLKAAEKAAKDVHVWTVNDPRQMTAMIDRGVKNIITDEVDALVALRRELVELSDAERIVLAFRNSVRR